MPQPLLSIVVPMRNEAGNVEPLVTELTCALEGTDWELIAVLDSCTDDTLSNLRRIRRRGADITILVLDQAQGQHQAIVRGMHHARGRWILSLDADMEIHARYVPALLNAARDSDGASAVRTNRQVSMARSVLSAASRIVLRSLPGRLEDRPADPGCMARIWKREVVLSFLASRQQVAFLPTQVCRFSQSTAEVGVPHSPRSVGQSNYSAQALASLGLRFLRTMPGRLPAQPGQPTRIVLAGYGLVGRQALYTLCDMGSPPCLVLTHPTAHNDFQSGLVDEARSRGIEVIENPDFTSANTEASIIMSKLKPDLLLSVFYKEIFPPHVLAIPRIAAVNIHPSLLPAYRGRSPINWTVEDGARETGVTMHLMTPRPDCGPVVARQLVGIGDNDTAWDLLLDVRDETSRLIRNNLDGLVRAALPMTRQDHAVGFTRGRRTPESGRLNRGMSAWQVHNRVRANCWPWHGAFIEYSQGKSVVLGRSLWSSDSGPRACRFRPDGTIELKAADGTALVAPAQSSNLDDPVLQARIAQWWETPVVEALQTQ